MTELTRDEKLVVLIEECGGVIQAATRCLRLGWDHEQKVLAAEVGDLIGMADALDLDKELVKAFRANRLLRAVQAKSGSVLLSPRR